MIRALSPIAWLPLAWALPAATLATAMAPAAMRLGPQADAAKPSFLTAGTVVHPGRTTTIPLRLAAPAAGESTWEVTSSDPSKVEVLGPARALPGESFAFVRVRANGTGNASLSAAGAQLDVQVKALTTEASVRRPVPTIVAPAQGAHVWGTFSVGVEFPLGARAEGTSVELITAGGKSIGKVREVESARGPERRLAFAVNAEDFPRGPLTFRAQTRTGDVVHQSGPLILTVRHPTASEIVQLEWEATTDGERPEEYGARHPAIARDAQASGGRALAVRGFNPMPVVSVDVPTGGRWQVVARMRGDLGAGAFPTVALSLNAPYTYAGAVRVIDRSWHRVPVGPPIELEKGAHWLGLRITNPANAGRAEERHLYVDTLELVRVEDAGAGASDSMMSMQSMQSVAPADATMEDGNPGAKSMMSSPRGAPSAGNHWVGLHTVFDGRPMNGKLMLEGVTNWTGGAAVPAPVVELVVDGTAIAKTQSSEPIFAVFPEELGPGAHQVQFRSTQPGRGTRHTPMQTLLVDEGFEHVPLRREHRITMQDQAWRIESGTGELGKPSGPIAAAFELPADWEGRFLVHLDARGPGGDHAADAHLKIEGMRAGEFQKIAESSIKVKNWWNERRIGEVELEPGQKTLSLRLVPDDSEEKGADLLQVRSLVFERAPARDSNPPMARIAYPAAGHATFDLDAVVVEASDDTGISSVELLIDGRPAGAFARPPKGAGRIVLPLWADALSPGEHTASVRVLDGATNQCDSEEVAFTVLGSAPAEAGPFPRAVHLLDRLGYGPSMHDLAQVLTLGESAWLEEAFTKSAGDSTATELAQATLGEGLPYGATQLALRAALTTDNPVRSRFAFFVDNHFSTWSGKTGVPSEYMDHLRWQELGFAPFAELLMASVTNPVMLIYLDQQQSFRDRLNENFARELLELHTVGVNGGYDQEDVTELAGLLTGLTVSEEAPITGSGQYRKRVVRYAPDLASQGGADVLGMRFDDLADPSSGYARIERIVEHLAAHPHTARYWSVKLAEYYVSSPAPAALVDDLTKAFHGSGGDPRALLRCIAQHPAFWDAIDVPRMATPFDFALRLGRATTPRHLYGPLDAYMKEAGMGLFDHAAPDGYPVEDAAYIDSNAMLSRWRVAQKFPWAARALAPEEARRGLGNGADAFCRTAIRHAAFALLGRPLGEDSTQASMEFMRELQAEPAWKRVDQMTVLMTRLPEASAR